MPDRENVELEDVRERFFRQQLLVREALQGLDDVATDGRLLVDAQVAFAQLPTLKTDDVDDGLVQELGGLVDGGAGNVEAQG